MKHIPRILNCAAVKLIAVLDILSEQQSTGIDNQGTQHPDEIAQLAICQKSEGKGVALFYCDDDWKTLRSRYFDTLDEAVRNANVEYSAVSVTWLTPQEAARRQGKYAMDPHCAFCGKAFSGYEKLIAGDGSYICHGCVDYYHERFAADLRPGRSYLSGAL